MSQSNVEIVRRAFKQWQDGGGTAASIPVDVYAEDVGWDLSGYPLVDLPTRGSGRDHLFAVFAEYLSGWKSYEPKVTEFIDAGDSIVAVVHEKAAVAESGVVLERDVFQVLTLSDGLCVQWRIFEARDPALQAVGLSE
jgi:ketosteroid isomerase-like protein